MSNPTGNEQSITDRKEINVIKSGNNYILTGIEGTANVKLYSVTGRLLLDACIQDGDELPFYNSKPGIALLWVKNKDEVYTHNLIL